MKKFALLAIIALTAASCNKSQPNDTGSNQNTNTPSPAPTAQTYTNAQYGFGFTYPSDMVSVSPSYANLADKIVQVQIPQEKYAKTNFGDAAITVSAASAKSLADCLKLSQPENTDGFKTKVTINGVDFYMTKSTGAGAGNLYESQVYRTLKGGNTCLEISETIHTSNIGNYTPGSVTEVNKTEVQGKLDTVLHSFKLTN